MYSYFTAVIVCYHSMVDKDIHNSLLINNSIRQRTLRYRRVFNQINAQFILKNIAEVRNNNIVSIFNKIHAPTARYFTRNFSPRWARVTPSSSKSKLTTFYNSHILGFNNSQKSINDEIYKELMNDLVNGHAS